jgi:3-oxoadipate enol-lactonase
MLNVTDLGEGTPILWIHAYPLSSEIFESQLGIKGVRHIMPDLPGFGQSRAPVGAMSMDDYARVILDLLDHRGIDRAIFAGVSMGGYVCFAAHRLAPERFAGLMLIDTRETPDDAKARLARLDSIEKVKAQGLQPVIDVMLPKMLTSEAPRELVEKVRTIMSSSSKEGVIAALGALATRPDSTDTLRKVSVPTLIVVGEEDSITPPADAERMSRLNPHASLVRLAHAAHLANFERPDEFNRAVGAFVSKI